MEGFIESFLGAVFGAAVSFFFYQQSGRELRREAESLRQESLKLRNLQELTIYVLTNPGANIQPRRDEAGNIVGLYVSASGSAMGRASMRGEMTLTPKTPDETEDH